jgi:hypothetical protein
MADNLEKFMVGNTYIDTSVQKGFLKGMAGCVEHTFALFEEIKDAYSHHLQIVVDWLDFANAYGNVMHNLVQFALEWYHVPKWVCRMVFEYYERLVTKVVTKSWETAIFMFLCGLF